MARLRAQDTSFLAVETPAAPMHVGLLVTCRMPRGARSDFMQRLHAHLAGCTADAAPFNLLASVPVALPRADGDTIGSSVATIHTSLATTLRDPRRRLLAIRETMRAAKAEFRTVPASLHRAINALGMQVAMKVPKYLSPRAARAAFTNLTISNVPGPGRPLYFGGARIEGMYPLSVLVGDQRLNLTVVSYDRRLHVGLVGCPDVLPSVQYLAVQLPAALRALEVSLARARGRRGGARVAQVDR